MIKCSLFKISTLLFLVLITPKEHFSQENNSNIKPDLTGTFSLGVRSTLSLFDHDGTGLGTGGQFRLQLSDRVNTEWFADYININTSSGVKSTYYHIGWSVMFYPFEDSQNNHLIQPYILAGHCFDFNEKTLINQPEISKSRWGSAVQTGLGAHFNFSERFDISLSSQYMIHLTEQIEIETNNEGDIEFHEGSHPTLEGHLLTTISFNYIIAQLW